MVERWSEIIKEATKGRKFIRYFNTYHMGFTTIDLEEALGYGEDDFEDIDFDRINLISFNELEKELLGKMNICVGVMSRLNIKSREFIIERKKYHHLIKEIEYWKSLEKRRL